MRFIVQEFRKVLPPTLFFLVVFHVTAFTRGLMEESYGITPTGSAMATVGALIVGKVMLVADKSTFINRFATWPLIYGILWKTALFGVLGTVFQIGEEWLPLVLQYRSVSLAGEHLWADTVWPKFWANHILLLMWLLVYCTAVELIRVFGAERTRELFFGAKRHLTAGRRPRQTRRRR